MLLAAACLVTIAGCPTQTPDDNGGVPVYNNTADRTNAGATYIGSAACIACHEPLSFSSQIVADHKIHGHANVLTRINDGAPTFPEEAENAGGIQPPAGKQWSDVAYVIGGYLRRALFVDRNGYIMTNGAEGVDTQWTQRFVPTDVDAGPAAFMPNRTAADPLAYNFDCFRCHTTGAVESTAASPVLHENRPGMQGTFAEAGVQCEACHGPGSKHAPNPAARDIYVDFTGQTCTDCHTRATSDSDKTIQMDDAGFVANYQQVNELAASGGHANFSCLFCHEPHVSTNLDRERAVRNACTACHSDQNFTVFHENTVFVLGDHAEPVGCESCHMPFATRSATGQVIDITGFDGNSLGAEARIGDVRTHIFRISSENADYTGMSQDGAVVLDDQGRAAVSVDFVCLRCHNGRGNAFPLTVDSASFIAENMHNR